MDALDHLSDGQVIAFVIFLTSFITACIYWISQPRTDGHK